MKKFLTTLTLLATLAFAGKALALPTFDSGVTYSSGVSYSSLLTNGWTQVLNVNYGDATTFANTQDWLSTYAGYEIFVGAVDSHGIVYVGATGLVDDVLKETFSYTTASLYASSKLYWYNNSDFSFGFTPTSNIYLNSADVVGTSDFGYADDGKNDLRLSWHDGSAGWRAGNKLWLNGPSDYNKVVLVGKPSVGVPDASSTALLGLVAFGALIGIRRTKRS